MGRLFCITCGANGQVKQRPLFGDTLPSDEVEIRLFRRRAPNIFWVETTFSSCSVAGLATEIQRELAWPSVSSLVLN